ncbi:MAG TPA: hypothetical protein DCY13_15035 [Verrucomicrobiales bacterium]|nr:hypothetical protein [Verrucomicrobiales bacterium]
MKAHIQFFWLLGDRWSGLRTRPKSTGGFSGVDPGGSESAKAGSGRVWATVGGRRWCDEVEQPERGETLRLLGLAALTFF